MEVITAVAILLYQGQRLLVDDKLFLETGTVGCFVVSIGDVGDSDALGTVLCPDPIGIGQVDANSGRGVFIATEHGGTDGIGRHALDLRFAETGVYGGMVLEPLGIARDGLGALGSLEVLIFHNTFPRAFQSQRVAIDLDKTIDKIDAPLMLVDPRDAIVVKDAQIAGLVIVNQQLDDMGLVVVLGHGLRLFQPVNNMTDGIGIATGSRPYLFLHLAIALDQRGVESIGRGFGIVLVSCLLLGIEVFCLLLGNALIEMAGRGLYQVFAIGFVDTLGQDGRVENNGEELLTKGVHRFVIGQG